MWICNSLIVIFKFILIFSNLKKSLGNTLTDGLVAYWNFDDSDNWMNPAYGGQATSTVGSPSRSTSIKKFGNGSLYLDQNSYLSIPSPGTWLPAGNSAYSISLWLYRPIGLNQHSILVQWGALETSKSIGILIIDTQGGIHAHWYGNNDLTCYSSTCPLPLNVWHHVVVIFDGTTQIIYLDGVSKASRTPSGKNTVRTNFFIGHIDVHNQNWNGYIDDLGIYNRALTPTEVQKLYTSAIMPMDVTNGLVAYWNFDDADNWINPAYGGQTTSIGGGTPSRSTSFKMFGSGSLYLDGNSHLKIVNPGTWLPAGSSAYSVSLWYRARSISPNYVLYFFGSNVNSKGVGLHSLDAQGGIRSYWWNNDLSCPSSTCPLTINNWYHLVDTYDGTTHRLYFNGVSKVSRTPSGKDTSRSIFHIGAHFDHTFLFNGYIDDLGIFNRGLTATEVQTLFNSAIIPMDVTNGLVAYWNFDDADNWMNPAYGGQTTSVGGGTPSRSTSYKMFGSGSLYLDGNSYLSIPTPGTWLPAGSSSYSISLWFYRPTGYITTGYYMLIHWGSYVNNKATGLLVTDAAGGFYAYWWNNDLTCSSAICPISVNTWYHVVDTYDGTTQKLYLNGVLKAIRTASGKATERTNFLIGSRENLYMNGYIDDFGIYNRALTMAEVQTLYNSAIIPSSTSLSVSDSAIIANMSSQIYNLKADMIRIETNISSINHQINNIKSNTSEILLELSKMKISMQKLSATLTRQRKRERSKNNEF